jgi:hypothetical protein
MLFDDTIDRLTAHGVDLSALEHVREELGETTGIMATTEAVASMQMHLTLLNRFGHNSNENDVPATRQEYEQMLKSFLSVSNQLRQLKSLTHERGMHELAPRQYSRKRAEALIMSDTTILEEDKPKWLAVIADTFSGEPLDVHDPEASSYLTVHQAEDLADAMKDANVARLKVEFVRLIREAQLPTHDELPTMATLASFAVGYVCADAEGQKKSRQFSLIRASQQAKKMGWSDELFEHVIHRLQAALEQ